MAHSSALPVTTEPTKVLGLSQDLAILRPSWALHSMPVHTTMPAEDTLESLEFRYSSDALLQETLNSSSRLMIRNWSLLVLPHSTELGDGIRHQTEVAADLSLQGLKC